MPAVGRQIGFLFILAITACAPGLTPEQTHLRIFEEIRHGDLPAAEKQLAAIHQYWRRDPSKEWYWRFNLLEAELAVAKGKFADAAKLLETPVGNVPGRQEIEARRHLQLGYVRIYTRKYEAAESLLADAGKMADSANEQLQLEIGVARGVLASSTKPPEVADRLLSQTYQRAVALKNPYFQAAILNNLGVRRLNRFRYDEAAPFLQRALEAAREAKADLMATSILGNLAICTYRLGDFEKALGMRQKAAELQRKVNALAKLQVSLGEFGNMQYLQGDATKAIPYFRDAFELAQKINDPEFASLWAANLTQAYASLQDWDAAERTNRSIRSYGLAKPGTRFERLLRLNDAAIASGRGHDAEAIRLYEEVIGLSRESPGTQWQAHANLADLLTRLNRPEEANRHFELALEVITKTRAALLQAEYKITFVDSVIRFYRRYVDVLVQRGEFDKALHVTDSSRALLLAEKAGLDASHGSVSTDFEGIARSSGASLVSYWLAPERSYVWLVNARKTQVFELPGEQQITRLVDAHSKTIADLRDPLTIRHPASVQLSDILLGPIRASIPKGGRVIVVPDRALHRINFDTLIAGDHYWIEDAALAIAPSLGILGGRGRRWTGGPQAMLLIGNPAYRAADAPRLEYAASEMQSIRQAMTRRAVTIFSGEQARPVSYRNAELERFALIHFAAHAIANPSSPLDSAILLAPDGDDVYKLYARDFLSRPLRAELVTISACRSAGARSYSGEGLVGLAWAVLQAGAQNVIGGLWDVNDGSTADLMGTLYGGLQGGLGPADALHEAKLKLMKSKRGAYRSPYYWAPFQVYIQTLPWHAKERLSLAGTQHAGTGERSRSGKR